MTEISVMVDIVLEVSYFLFILFGQQITGNPIVQLTAWQYATKGMYKSLNLTSSVND